MTLHEAMLRHAKYYAELLWEQSQLFQEQDDIARRKALDNLEKERRQIEQGQSKAASLVSRDRRAAQICIDYTSPGFLAYLQFSIPQRIRWAEEALAGARQWQPDPSVEARLLAQLGGYHRHAGRIEEANRYYSSALELATRNEDMALQFSVSSSLASLYQTQKQYAEAEELLHSVLESDYCVAESRANCLGALAGLYYDQELFEKAEEHYRQALALNAELSLKDQQIGLLCDIGNALAAQHQYPQAQAHYRQALHLARETGDALQRAIVLNYLGIFLTGQNQLDEAMNQHLEAAAIQKEIGDKPGLAITLWNLAKVFVNLTFHSEALRCFQAVLTIVRELGDIPFEGEVLESLGDFWLSLGNRIEAVSNYGQARAAYQTAGAHRRTQKLTEKLAAANLLDQAK